MYNNYSNDIKLIQGDTFQRNVSITGISKQFISKVYFTCAALDINKELTYDETIHKYVIKLESDETKVLKAISTNFDITVIFSDVDESVKTAVYKQKITVLSKNNALEVL